jgi:hypothetical protein
MTEPQPTVTYREILGFPELYPESRWHWQHLEGGRTQTRGTPPEVLLVNAAPAGQQEEVA